MLSNLLQPYIRNMITLMVGLIAYTLLSSYLWDASQFLSDSQMQKKVATFTWVKSLLCLS